VLEVLGEVEKVTFINRDKTAHEIKLYNSGIPGEQRTIVLESGRKASIKVVEPGRYLFHLATNPNKIGVLEVG